jgi:hypothetical protein
VGRAWAPQRGWSWPCKFRLTGIFCSFQKLFLMATCSSWPPVTLVGGSHAETKRKSGGAYIRPKPALRGRPRPPGWPLAPPRASWVVWWCARRRAWPGAASRYRPREKVPKNTFLEGPILTLPSYQAAAHRSIEFRPASNHSARPC